MIEGTWNFDMDAAPRGRMETVVRTVSAKDGTKEVSHVEFHPDIIFAASKCGKVIKSYMLQNGRWAGFATGESPIAWMPYIVPAHPGVEIAA